MDKNSPPPSAQSSGVNRTRVTKESICFKCGHTGHLKNECPYPNAKMYCYNCNSQLHLASACPYPKKKNNNMYENSKCHQCGKLGHLARDCPSKPITKQLQIDHDKKYTDIKCFACGKNGHTSKNCQNKKK